MKRIAILIEKNQTIGRATNIAAILMGELAVRERNIFTLDVIDKEEKIHSSINYSTVMLKINSSLQIINLVNSINLNEVSLVLFNEIGQGLHNQFVEYKDTISKLTTEETRPIGILIYGDDEVVRKIVKKYSLLK